MKVTDNNNLYTIEYRGWIMVINKCMGDIDVWYHGERRGYQIPVRIEKITHEDEYVFLDVETTDVYQFKFEHEGFLVGDIYDRNDEFKDTFACHVFGE